MIEEDKALDPRTSPGQRIVTLLAVLIPFAGMIAAICSLWGWGFTWVDLVTLLVMCTVTLAGVSVGYHRLFTHRSFETVWPVKFVLAVLGSMAAEGPVLKWVAVHRRHHQFSDEEGDPHSPQTFGKGLRNTLVGLWHAHIGWMFTSNHPNLTRYVRDLRADKLVRRVSSLFSIWVILGLLIPAVVGGLLTRSWTGALLGFLWGGLARTFVVHHLTFSINSICHMWGRRPFRNSDESRNNLIFGVLGFGEGWHNNHHAFPTSARHGLRWWEVDFGYVVIRALGLLGLAWSVHVPTREKMAAKRAHASATPN